MPPKKKQKNTRTDAALDAMRLYGFPDDLIRTHLKQLLKVYGQDHWFFIEENAYKVLLDSILEQVEQDAIPQPAYKELHQGDTGAGTSREVPAFPHYDEETSDIALQTREGLDQFNGACDTALLTCKPDGGGGYLSPTGEVTDPNQINWDPNYFEKHFTAAIETSAVDQIGNANFSPMHASHFPQGVKVRRRHHHGWIDSDEEEDELGLVELEPMPLAPELASLHGEARSGRQGGI